MAFLSLQQLPTETATQLWNEAFSDYFVPIRMDEAAFQQRLLAYDLSPQYSTIATVEDDYAGIMLYGIDGDAAWIGGMATMPKYRGYGIARSLVAQAVTQSQALGIKILLLEVIVGNDKAINLYDSTNFKEVNRLGVAQGSLTAYEQVAIRLQETAVEQKHLDLQPQYIPWQTHIKRSPIVVDLFLQEQWLGYLAYQVEKDCIIVHQLVFKEPTQALVEAVITALYEKYGAVVCQLNNFDITTEVYQYLLDLGFEEQLQQIQMKYDM
ncbi:hypothetical protein GCM10007425_08560 [Lysinibacillus alkalisoli]|uniref:N-acetyltransferase domain-containing protein n=1 Tax=Lysinibacillus alkalisoli TaxID=1911548 RepID=A0A917G0C3_9BACI|nr:GNAT family N-acetyltransferase [Lysinibacillus alkalisoli]GGG16484.1 hypothetical protein GCM10007425_08560 [Lysinibacillus alkalisoli]